MKVGTKVRTRMGCREEGTVIRPCGTWNDGSYRWPYPHERVAWVQWNDGTHGWTYISNLEVIA